MSVLDIAEAADLPFADVRAYLQRFADRGLVRLEPVTMGRPPARRLGR
jgi:predicted ArsR family transcriptional regulator